MPDRTEHPARTPHPALGTEHPAPSTPHPALSSSDAMPCDRCGAAMFRMHAVWRCPTCGYKTDCCGW